MDKEEFHRQLLPVKLNPDYLSNLALGSVVAYNILAVHNHIFGLASKRNR